MRREGGGPASPVGAGAGAGRGGAAPVGAGAGAGSGARGSSPFRGSHGRGLRESAHRPCGARGCGAVPAPRECCRATPGATGRDRRERDGPTGRDGMGWIGSGQNGSGQSGSGWVGSQLVESDQDGDAVELGIRMGCCGRRGRDGDWSGPNGRPRAGSLGRGQRLCRRRGLRAPHSAPRSPQAYAAAAPGPGRLLKAGAAVLIAGALLLLAGAIGAFYFWKATERQVSTSSHRGGRGAG